MNITDVDIVWFNEVIITVHFWLFLFVTVLTIYFFYRLMGAKRVHANFRLVLCCAAGSFFVFSASRQLVHFLINQTQDIENRLFINLICVALSTIHMISVMSSALCMNMLAIEQHLATIWVNDYERRSSRIGLILLFIVTIQSVPTGCFINWWYIRQDYDFFTSKESCIPVETHWELAMMGYCACFISCMICSIWLLWLHKYNMAKTKNRLNMKTLSARFQQTENENSNKSIAPSILGYMVLGMVGIFLSETRRRIVANYGEDHPGSELMTHLGYMSLDFYALHHMFCFMYFNNAMRSLIRRDITYVFGVRISNSCNRGDSIQPETQRAETETYFKQFNSAWG